MLMTGWDSLLDRASRSATRGARRARLLSLAILMLLGVACRREPPPPVLLQLPPFELTSSDDKPFGSEELRGKIYVANFVFTRCPTSCPKLMAKMQQLQTRTKSLAERVHLLTISVDPENDTPSRLKTYGARFGVEPGRWTLLTGNLEAIEKTIVSGFKLAMGRDAGSLMEIFHSERFVVVDARGQIRGYYEATDEGLERLQADLERLVGSR